MTTAQAIKIAQECIRFKMRYLSPQANLCDIHHADFPSAVRASDERKRLWEAVDVLEAMVRDEYSRPPTANLPMWKQRNET